MISVTRSVLDALTNFTNRDFQKLIFYYYADRYINFKDLITELYRIYKTRIWLSAINPASFSQHALGSPPSGIGAGAVTGYDSSAKSTYTMAYGQDPDPYGAIPPYRIGYNTYTPNYPAIPGVANSFAPNVAGGSAYPAYGTNNSTPSLPPGVIPTGTAADYNYYYERKGIDKSNMGKAHTAPNMFASPFVPQQPPVYSCRAIPSFPSDRGYSRGSIDDLPYDVAVATGRGRQATLPTPIGARAPTNENNNAAPPYVFQPRLYRIETENVGPDNTPTRIVYLGNQRMGPAPSARLGENLFGGILMEDGTRLIDPEDERADAMSRER